MVDNREYCLVSEEHILLSKQLKVLKKDLEDSKQDREDELDLKRAEMRGYNRKYNIVIIHYFPKKIKNNFFFKIILNFLNLRLKLKLTT